MKRVLWFVQFLAVVLITLPVAVIPYKISLRLGGALGSLLFFFWGSRRRIAVDNLRSAVSRGAVTITSSPEDVIRENFKNLGKSFVEVLKIYYCLGRPVFERIEITGAENVGKAYEKGRGVLYITGHCGNREVLALTVGMRLGKVHAVARADNNPFLNRLVEKARRTYGNIVIYKGGALKKTLAALKSGEAVGILMDQSVVRSEGVIMEFLGKKDYTMKTPALIAMKTGAPVIPAFIRRVEGGHRIEIGEEIALDKTEDSEKDVYTNTVKFSRCIEEYIRHNPAEWLWIHRRWKRIKE